MNIYVGNLSGDVTEDDLRELFETLGQVESINIIKDRFSGESRGFGFVEMPTLKEALSAVNELDGKDLKGRIIKVNEARPKAAGRRDGGRRGGGRRGGGQRGGGDRRGGFSRGSSGKRRY